MRWLHALIALLVTGLPAAAEPPPRPYTPVQITRPDAWNDAGFTKFRHELAAIAEARVYARLASLVHDRDFFWDRDFGRRLDPRKPAIDNLALAIALEHDNGTGWTRLAEFAAEPSAEPLESRPGVVCAPARPRYDGVAYGKLLDVTYTDALDWAYPRADTTPVRVAPEPKAAAVGALGTAFVRLLGFSGPDSEPNPGGKLWARVAMPDGRIGFVAPNSLMSLTAERLCYVRDTLSGWQIVGFVAGGN